MHSCALHVRDVHVCIALRFILGMTSVSVVEVKHCRICRPALQC